MSEAKIINAQNRIYKHKGMERLLYLGIFGKGNEGCRRVVGRREKGRQSVQKFVCAACEV